MGQNAHRIAAAAETVGRERRGRHRHRTGLHRDPPYEPALRKYRSMPSISMQ